MTWKFLGNLNGEFVELPDESGLNDIKAKWCAKFGTSLQRTIPIGFHGYGVPHQVSSTLLIFSWNFLSFPGAERYPFAMVEKEYMCDCGCSGRCTIDAVLEVLLWSMRCLMTGQSPSCRHDKSAWRKTDQLRSKTLPKKLVASAAMLQVRDDWAFYKHMSSSKGWSSNGICWGCLANREGHPV